MQDQLFHERKRITEHKDFKDVKEDFEEQIEIFLTFLKIELVELTAVYE